MPCANDVRHLESGWFILRNLRDHFTWFGLESAMLYQPIGYGDQAAVERSAGPHRTNRGKGLYPRVRLGIVAILAADTLGRVFVLGKGPSANTAAISGNSAAVIRDATAP